VCSIVCNDVAHRLTVDKKVRWRFWQVSFGDVSFRFILCGHKMTAAEGSEDS